jgi:hypothetical protein
MVLKYVTQVVTIDVDIVVVGQYQVECQEQHSKVGHLEVAQDQIVAVEEHLLDQLVLTQ